MKVYPFIVSLLTSLLLFSYTQAQDFFEGSITFSVEMKGPMVEQLKDNEPTKSLTMHLKEGDYIVLLKGGRYPKTFLFVADSNYEYSIDMANKMAYKYSPHSDVNRNKSKILQIAKPTGKQVTVQGILCDEYKMRREDVIFTYYVNDAYRVDRTKFPPKTRAKASFLARGLEGRIPLKTIKRQRNLIVVTTATKIDKREFDPKQFQIPPGFTVKGRDYRY